MGFAEGNQKNPSRGKQKVNEVQKLEETVLPGELVAQLLSACLREWQLPAAQLLCALRNCNWHKQGSARCKLLPLKEQ